jgi:signal transduction histidine kinase
MNRTRRMSLSSSAWSRRHTTVVLASVAILPLIALVGYLTGTRVEDIGSRVLVVALFLVLAASTRISETQRSLLGTAGALVAASAVVGAAGGHPAAHLTFPFVLALVTLYRKVPTTLLSVAYLSVYYGLVALRAPEIVFDEELIADTHVFILGVVAVSLASASVGIISWILDTGAAREITALSTALADAALRQRQATELHDTVIQGLALATYALDAGDTELARDGVNTALGNAKNLVGSLLTIEGADLSALVTRTEPAALTTGEPDSGQHAENTADRRLDTDATAGTSDAGQHDGGARGTR